MVRHPPGHARGFAVLLARLGFVLLVGSALALAAAASLRAQSGGWTATRGDGAAFIASRSVDGAVSLDGGCNARLGPGFRATLSDYAGTALQRVDDRSEEVVFTVRFQDGSTEPFHAPMHYFAPDEAHVLSQALPVDFLDALARGDRLTLANAAGETVAEWDLTGTAASRRIMREACGF